LPVAAINKRRCSARRAPTGQGKQRPWHRCFLLVNTGVAAQRSARAS
jgi:hypothetical protein